MHGRVLSTIAISLLLWASPVLGEPQEHAEQRAAIVKPGGGFVVSDGVSVVPMEIVITGPVTAAAVAKARIVSSVGKIENARVVSKDRLAFQYRTPKRRDGADEIFDVSVELSDGNTLTEVFTVHVPPPRTTAPAMAIRPEVFDAGQVGTAEVEVRGEGQRAGLFTGLARLDAPTMATEEGRASARAALQAPDTPADAPSHFTVLGLVAGPTGFGAAVGALSVRAPIRLSVQVAPGARLEVQGAENKPPPVEAKADGLTVMENVVVRYGASVRGFQVQGKQRKEVSLVIPSGLVATGVVGAIPGQANADGGTGPSIVVAAPPPPFGGPVLWPQIALDGAKLVSVQNLSDKLRALVIERPTEPRAVGVLLDGEQVATIPFGALRGSFITSSELPPKDGERAALEIAVLDSLGRATAEPEPRVRLESGEPLTLEKLETGRYRLALPMTFPGKEGESVELAAELDPPLVFAGDPLFPIKTQLSARLGRAPAPVATANVETKAPEPAPREADAAVRFGLVGTAVAGTTFGSMFLFGGGVLAELRLPVLENRIAIRTGVEFTRASGSGEVVLEEGAQASTTLTVGGFLFPLDVGFAVVSMDGFELLVRAGAALRVEQGRLEVGGDSPGGGQRVGFGGRATLEGDFDLGTGAIVVGATIEGLGASAEGLGGSTSNVVGTLTNVRGDAGFRIWF